MNTTLPQSVLAQLDQMLRRAANYSNSELMATLQVINDMPEPSRGLYLLQLAGVFVTRGELNVVQTISKMAPDDPVFEAGLLLTIAENTPIEQVSEFTVAVDHARSAMEMAFHFETSHWGQATLLRRLAKLVWYEGELDNADTIWMQAVNAAASGQDDLDEREREDCCDALVELVADLVKFGRIELAHTAIQAIKDSNLQKHALATLKQVSGTA